MFFRECAYHKNDIIPSQPATNYLIHEIDLTKKENDDVFSLLKKIKGEI